MFQSSESDSGKIDDRLFLLLFLFYLFFLLASDAEVLSDSVTDPALLPSSLVLKKKDMIRALGSERKERKQKEEGPGLATTGPPRNQPLLCLSPPRLTMGAEESVFMDPHGPTIAPMCPTAVTADKIKHIHFQKESKNLFLPTISVLPLCSQSAQPFQPFATQAIPVVSTCVMTAVR